MTNLDYLQRTVGRAAIVAAVAGALVAGCTVQPSVAPTGAAPSPTVTLAASPTAQPGASPTATTTPGPSPTPGTAIVPGQVDRTSLAVAATYDVGLDIAVRTGEITVAVEILATNDSGGPIDRLELNTIAARLGGITVLEATVDDRPVAATIDDQTLLVPLGGTLPASATASLRIVYAATLRSDLDGSNWLFSRAGGIVSLYRWIPWVSRAIPFDRPNFGDPFVMPSSRLVRVRVTTDQPMILASPGVNPVFEGGSWSFEVADVRDVALALAPDFQVTRGDAAGITIRAYTRPGGLDPDALIAQATRALDRMANRVGVAYPWPAFSIVETAGGYGMESPGLIWVPGETAPEDLAYLVHHETAHQWFYGLVGNDQQAEPFADEAAADLLARTVLGTLRGSRCDPAALDRAIPNYSRACYYEVIYIQGGNALDDLRAAMGTERFWGALRDYLTANRFGLGGTRQLLEALRAASPVDLLPTLRARFPSLY